MPRGAFTDCWKKIIFCFFSGFWAKTFRFFVSSLFGMVVKTLFYVSRKLSEENELFRKKRVFCFFFGFLAGVFRIFGAIFRGMDFKSAFCMSIRKFRGEVFFGITLSADTFEFWAQIFQGFGEKNIKSVVRIAF